MEKDQKGGQKEANGTRIPCLDHLPSLSVLSQRLRRNALARAEDKLFRAFLWMAEHEGRWGAVDGWLDRALAAPAKRE